MDRSRLICDNFPVASLLIFRGSCVQSFKVSSEVVVVNDTRALFVFGEVIVRPIDLLCRFRLWCRLLAEFNVLLRDGQDDGFDNRLAGFTALVCRAHDSGLGNRLGDGIGNGIGNGIGDGLGNSLAKILVVVFAGSCNESFGNRFCGRFGAFGLSPQLGCLVSLGFCGLAKIFIVHYEASENVPSTNEYFER